MSINNLLNDKSVFIFDFDGVLVDSIEIKTTAFAFLYKEYGDNIVKRVVNHHMLNGGISRYEKFKHYHNYFLNVDINEKEINRLDKLFSKFVINKVVKANEIDGAKQFLNKKYLKNNLYINSATPQIEILEIIKRKGWVKYFKKIYGSPKSKIANLEAILNYEDNISKNDCVFFGDAESDYKAANKLGIDFILLRTSNMIFPFTKKVQHKISNFNRL